MHSSWSFDEFCRLYTVGCCWTLQCFCIWWYTDIYPVYTQVNVTDRPDYHVDWYWKLGPFLLLGMGQTLAIVLFDVFVIAQSLDKMKGLAVNWINAGCLRHCILHSQLFWPLGVHLVLRYIKCCFISHTVHHFPSSFQMVHTMWEEQRDQLTGHCRGTLWEVHGPRGRVSESTALLMLYTLLITNTMLYTKCEIWYVCPLIVTCVCVYVCCFVLSFILTYLIVTIVCRMTVCGVLKQPRSDTCTHVCCVVFELTSTIFPCMCSRLVCLVASICVYVCVYKWISFVPYRL